MEMPICTNLYRHLAMTQKRPKARFYRCRDRSHKLFQLKLAQMYSSHRYYAAPGKPTISIKYRLTFHPNTT